MQVIIPAKILSNIVPTNINQTIENGAMVEIETVFTAGFEKSKAGKGTTQNTYFREHLGCRQKSTNLNADFLKSRSIDEILDETGLGSFHWKMLP